MTEVIDAPLPCLGNAHTGSATSVARARAATVFLVPVQEHVAGNECDVRPVSFWATRVVRRR